MDFLHPYGNLDVLWRYGKVAPYLQNFLWTKEVASKIVGKDFILLERGTKNPPLYIKDFEVIDEDFLQLRANNHLKDVNNKLTEKQILLRKYFVPRKLADFFYATNHEYGKTMDRIFIDIDRQDNNAADAQKTARELVKTLQTDKALPAIIKFKILILWTGSSFHLLLILGKPVDHATYDRYFSYGPHKSESFITARANQVSKQTWLTVLAGHERKRGALILDSSNTPPGKLGRCPFSLHIKDAKTIDGIAVPVTLQELGDKKLISRLQSLTPETIRKEIKKYSKIIESSQR